MKDNLEKFVKNNREAFEDHEPSSDLWKKIAAKTAKKDNDFVAKIINFSKQKFTLGIAASIAILLTISYLAFNYGRFVSQNSDIMVMSPRYAKELTQFASLIEEKREELKVLEQENPQLYHQFDAEIKILDQNYQQLRGQLPKNPNQEDLLKAMIQNLNIQIDLLNQQLEIIQKIKDAKNEKSKTII